MKRERSSALYQKAVNMIPGGVNSPVRGFKHVGGTPVYFARASGSRFRDADGNEYVDFCQSWGPLILGHSHPRVVQAVCEAAPMGLSYGACHEKEVAFASLVLEAFPEFDRVRAVCSGTEAVMTALRIARGFTGRDLIVKFDGGYHGHVDSMLVKAGSGLATFAMADSAGIPESIAASTLVAALDDEQSVEALFQAHSSRIAAVIIEPMPANNGLLLQRTEFLQFLRDITAKHGAMLIFDEVISGFRLKYGGFGQIVGVAPDMVTLGKIVGGGMPIGAVVGRSDAMDKLAPLGSVYQAGTLSGNPVSLAAGIATLKELKENPPYEKLDRLGALLADSLAAGGNPNARCARMGSVGWLYLCQEEFPRNAARVDPNAVARFKKIYWKLLDRGFYLPPSSMEVMFISAAHTSDEIVGLASAVTDELAAI